MNGRWAYLYGAVDSRDRTVDLCLSSHRNSIAAYWFLGKILNNVKRWQILCFINTDNALTYGRALALLKREGGAVEGKELIKRELWFLVDEKALSHKVIGFTQIRFLIMLIKDMVVGRNVTSITLFSISSCCC